MDESKLTDAEVQWLLRGIKRPANPIELRKFEDDLRLENFDRVVKEFVIFGYDGGPDYVLNFRMSHGLREGLKYDISLRFRKSNIQFVRFDFGRIHNNPNGSEVGLAHIHVYDSKFVKQDSVAHEADNKRFPNPQNTFQSFKQFLQLINLKV